MDAHMIIAETMGQFDHYLDRLGESEADVRAHDGGSPKCFPALVVSFLEADQFCEFWHHRFVYGIKDDLSRIKSKLLMSDERTVRDFLRAVSLSQDPGSSPPKGDEPPKEPKKQDEELVRQAKWNDFWDDVEEAIHGSSVTIPQSSAPVGMPSDEDFEAASPEEREEVLKIYEHLYTDPGRAEFLIQDYLNKWWPARGILLDVVNEMIKELDLRNPIVHRGQNVLPFPGNGSTSTDRTVTFRES